LVQAAQFQPTELVQLAGMVLTLFLEPLHLLEAVAAAFILLGLVLQEVQVVAAAEPTQAPLMQEAVEPLTKDSEVVPVQV
jgi:hypothetical protein